MYILRILLFICILTFLSSTIVKSSTVSANNSSCLRPEENKNSTINEYQGFIDTVIEELEKDGLDPYKSALEVYTTMDRKKQDYINDIMNGKSWDWKDSKVTAGIAVVDVDNGELLAVGAGRDKNKERTFNTATQLNNQIGSTAKPLYEYSE